MTTSADSWLDTYLRDHLAAANAGLRLFQRVAQSHSNQTVRDTVASMVTEIEDDRRALRDMMLVLGVRENTPMGLLAVAAERVARLKPNGHLVSRSRAADLLELEALATAVEGKSRGWVVLRAVATRDDIRLDPTLLDELLDRAREQRTALEALHDTEASPAQ